jgi:hypothetical protein
MHAARDIAVPQNPSGVFSSFLFISVAVDFTSPLWPYLHLLLCGGHSGDQKEEQGGPFGLQLRRLSMLCIGAL